MKEDPGVTPAKETSERHPMRCPACSEQAISFFDWAKGLRWYQTRCDACGAKLRASSGTMLGFVLAILAGVVVGVAYHVLSDVPSPLLGLVIVVAVVTAGAVVTWFAGGGYTERS